LRYFVWIIAAMIAASAAYAQQDNAETDFTVTVIKRGTAVEITKYTGTGQKVRIPERIQNLPVTSVGEQVFAGKKLTSVIIPDSVTHIGYGAF
jgi:hypothetical protein